MLTSYAPSLKKTVKKLLTSFQSAKQASRQKRKQKKPGRNFFLKNVEKKSKQQNFQVLVLNNVQFEENSLKQSPAFEHYVETITKWQKDQNWVKPVQSKTKMLS